MKNAYGNMRECVYHSPSSLPFLPPKLRKIAANFLPYSAGIEVECSWNDKYLDTIRRSPWSATQFDDINLVKCMEVNNDINEKRFRIPPGIDGLLALSDVCDYLSTYCVFNLASGIHIHTDLGINYNRVFTNIFNDDINSSYVQNSILAKLDKVGYKGTFNRRAINNMGSSWVRMQYDFKTMEIRIFKMAFDYNTILKNILLCQGIAKSLVSKY